MENKHDYFFGLTEAQVVENRTKYGSNKLKKIKKESFLQLLIGSLGDPIIRILIIALGIKLIFLIKYFDWYETIGIVIAIFIASLISTISEYGSEKAFEKLQEDASKIQCRVKRNNQVKYVNIEDIVVNDVVLLQAGDRIPADGIMIDGEITVDESSLNGETKEKYKHPLSRFSNTPNENNLVYKGTVVYSKEGMMIVTKVGHNTVYGRLALEIQEKPQESPLKIRLRHLAKIISRIGYLGAILVSVSYLFSVIVIANNFDLGLIKEMITNVPLLIGHVLYALTLSVTIIVVAVPEGLPMMITLVLSSNMKRMLKNNVLVRKMTGIETAGSINVLFTDKTGTITKGKLEVVRVIDGDMKEYRSESELKKNTGIYEMFKLNMVVNNASSYNNDKEITGGNSTDKALLSFFSDSITKIKKISNVPFDSKNKYSLTKTDDNQLLVKGAPEKIIPACVGYYDSNGKKRIILNKKNIDNKLSELTNQGIRVLALAKKEKVESESLSNLIFVGLVAIKDDIREQAITGLGLVDCAHIQTVMITGDNKETALAIGKEVNLIRNNDDLVLTSEELNKMDDEEIKKNFSHLRVVARALPQDKSKLVKIAQELRLVVGMTGDGVNDAPALKKADVGFAMGSGAEVAKEASDIVILDDNLLSIAKAILFGRTIFKSIRKFIIFQLTINMCAMTLSIIGPLIGIGTPVTVIQMLWINMVMDTLAGLAFAFEPPLVEYMYELPKKKDESIINRYMLNEILITGAYSSLLCLLFLKLNFVKDIFDFENGSIHLMSAFFGLFIFMSIFNCFNARTHRINIFANILKNKVFLITIISIAVIQIIMIYYGGELFRTIGLTYKEFLIMLGIAVSVIPFDWARKIMLRLRANKEGV